MERPRNKFQELFFFDCGYNIKQLAKVIKSRYPRAELISSSPWKMTIDEMMIISEVTDTSMEKMMWICVHSYHSMKGTAAGAIAAKSIFEKKLKP